MLRNDDSGAFFIPEFLYQPRRGRIFKTGQRPVYYDNLSLYQPRRGEIDSCLQKIF